MHFICYLLCIPSKMYFFFIAADYIIKNTNGKLKFGITSHLLWHVCDWTLILVNFSFKTAVTYLSHLCVFSLSFTVKTARPCESYKGSSQHGGGESDLACSWIGSSKTTGEQGPLSLSPVPTEAVLADQDQPLSFDHTRLSITAAAFRGPSVQHGSSQTQSLARMLQCGLPNLVNSSLRQTVSTQHRETENVDGVGQKSVILDPKSDCEETERIPDKPSNTRTTEERTAHVLGLDCYSSSDEDCGTWCFLIMTYNPQSSSFWITEKGFIHHISSSSDTVPWLWAWLPWVSPVTLWIEALVMV